MEDVELNQLSGKIVNAAYQVHKTLGPGLLEYGSMCSYAVPLLIIWHNNRVLDTASFRPISLRIYVTRYILPAPVIMRQRARNLIK